MSIKLSFLCNLNPLNSPCNLIFDIGDGSCCSCHPLDAAVGDNAAAAAVVVVVVEPVTYAIIPIGFGSHFAAPADFAADQVPPQEQKRESQPRQLLDKFVPYQKNFASADDLLVGFQSLVVDDAVGDDDGDVVAVVGWESCHEEIGPNDALPKVIAGSEVVGLLTKMKCKYL